MSSWEEQESYWNKHLDRLANEVKIDAFLIWDARKQLIVIFGEEWLKDSYKKLSKGNPTDEKGIVGVVSNPIVNNAVAVVELAKYLREFSGQPNFNEIVTKLKNAKDFKAIRLNLAFAYRMAKSGAKDVYVEPEIGDIEATISDQQYVIECSMIVPPMNNSNFANELFKRVINQVKYGDKPTWIDVTFNEYPQPSDLPLIVKTIKEAQYAYSKSMDTVERKEKPFTVKVTEASQEDIDSLPQKMKDEVWDFGFKIAMHQPKTPGDIYSVDLDEEPASHDGLFTIGKLINDEAAKSTRDRLRTKLKAKKAQTKQIPDTKRRMYVFMSNGMVEDDDWNELAKTFANDVKPTDNIDAVIFTDRRHHTYNDKLRYPSGQIHFYTSGKRVPHLEKLCEDMKQFEESDWIVES